MPIGPALDFKYLDLWQNFFRKCLDFEHNSHYRSYLILAAAKVVGRIEKRIVSMCLALLAKYNKIDIVFEQIFLSWKDTLLQAHEVYDIFFTAAESLENARIYAISPHNLVNNKDVTVRCAIPGAGSPDDVCYQQLGGYKGTYDAATRLFQVVVPLGVDPYKLKIEEYSGEVLVPDVHIPDSLTSDKLALDIMEECGTLFEISLGTLERGKNYAFRLIIDPLELLGVPPSRPLDLEGVDEIQYNWMQDAAIMCPKTCRFNFVELVSGIRQDQEEYAEAAANVQSIVLESEQYLLPVKRHHILAILPPEAELVTGDCEGYAWAVARHVLNDGRLAVVWSAGTKDYWMDDAESLAAHIYEHFKSWTSKGQSKTKEDVALSLFTFENNCSIIVDSLCNLGLLIKVDEDRYKAADATDAKLEETLREVAMLKEVVDGFKWVGYQIRYSFRYKYLSSEGKQLLSVRRRRRDLAYWISIAAFIIGLVSLLLGVILLLLDLFT